MATEKPSPEAEEVFDEMVDEATHAAIECFHPLGLPDGDQLSDLMVRLNDAIASVMRDWL
jgi:hypothetical protein